MNLIFAGLVTAAGFNLATSLEIFTCPTHFQAGETYIITYSPADRNHSVLALVQPDSSLTDWTADSLYNITQTATKELVTWTVKEDASYLWVVVDNYGDEWRFALCRNGLTPPCAKSDIIRAVRWTANTTSSSAMASVVFSRGGSG
ncbi:hypothetical protein E8E11_001822 [Didymella keratinophila]|nr:hypothetical protein E8E11_001822 [Didymella keratinophila]